MNRNWDTYISRVLGTFWNRIFKGFDIVKWVKYLHFVLKDRLIAYNKSAQCSVSVLHADDTSICMDVVDIPTTECTISHDVVGNYSLSGTVAKQTRIPSVGIPIKYLKNSVIIQDGPINPSMSWVLGSNARLCGDYMILYVPQGYDLPTVIGADTESTAIMYRLYIGRDCHNPNYTYNYGELCGIDMSWMDSYVRSSAWAAHMYRLTEESINTLISYSVGNDVCHDDSVVTDIWHEHEKHCIKCDDGNVYVGSGLPKVEIGDTVLEGELLFTGINLFNSDCIPAPSEVPYIMINSAKGDLIAYNKTIPTKQGYIGTIPDMGNMEWHDYVVREQSKGNLPMISDEQSINPLEYVLTTAMPSSLVYYSVSADISNTDAIYAIPAMIDKAYPTAHIIVSKHMAVGNGPQVNIDLTACVGVAVSGSVGIIAPKFSCSQCFFL